MDARVADFGTAPYTEMSPSLLAQQPPTPRKEGKADPTWGVLYAHLEARMGILRSWRWSWWTYWRVLAEFFDPKRFLWLITANRMWRGNPVNDAIIDSTGQLALRTCGSGMWSGLTNPARPWFKIEKGLPWVEIDADAQSWMEDTQERIYTVLHESNFYDTMSQSFRDLALFGTSPVIIYEDREDVVRFYLPAPGEYYLANGSRFQATVFFREFTLTVSQIVEQFTLESCPREVQSQWEQAGASLDREFVVCHAIEPNFDLEQRGGTRGAVHVLPSKFTYREVYWCKGYMGDRPMSKRGFNEKPFIAFRWSLVGNEPYGRGPCMDALGDNKQTQLETRRKAEFIEKGVRPPMGADPALKNEPASIRPGGITYTAADTGKKGFWPLFEPNPQWLPAISADIELVNKRVQAALFVDVFMAITRMEGVQPRNEQELTERDLERLQELGPVVNLATRELTDLLRRVMAIMERRKMLKPMPQSLINVPLKINFVSILKLAQKAAETISMKDVLATGGGMSSAAKAAGLPDPLRTMNLDKTYHRYAELSNFPMDCFWTDEQVEEHDQAREHAKAAAQIPPASMAAVQAAHTLSQTPVGGGSALHAMLTGQTAPQ